MWLYLLSLSLWLCGWATVYVLLREEAMIWAIGAGIVLLIVVFLIWLTFDAWE